MSIFYSLDDIYGTKGSDLYNENTDPEILIQREVSKLFILWFFLG